MSLKEGVDARPTGGFGERLRLHCGFLHASKKLCTKVNHICRFLSRLRITPFGYCALYITFNPSAHADDRLLLTIACSPTNTGIPL